MAWDHVVSTRVYTGPEGEGMEVTTRRRGRPALGDERKGVELKVRVTAAERAEVRSRARALGLTTTELIRGLLWPRTMLWPDGVPRQVEEP